MTKQEQQRQKAALSLDRTHSVGERGPKTFNARDNLARWLDGEPVSKRDMMSGIRWLMALDVK